MRPAISLLCFRQFRFVSRLRFRSKSYRRFVRSISCISVVATMYSLSEGNNNLRFRYQPSRGIRLGIRKIRTMWQCKSYGRIYRESRRALRPSTFKPSFPPVANSSPMKLEEEEFELKRDKVRPYISLSSNTNEDYHRNQSRNGGKQM